MTGAAWSWKDVPKHTPTTESRRRNAPGSGRHPHAVTLGHHDEVILPMVRRGDTAIYIAARVRCSPWLVRQRLRALGAEGWR